MAQRHAYSQPIQTYSLAPHNRNIWPSATPTANQYKHMAQRRIIETYGPAPHNRNIWPHNSRATVFCLRFWPILLFWWLWSTHYFYHISDKRIDITRWILSYGTLVALKYSSQTFCTKFYTQSDSFGWKALPWFWQRS